MLQIRKSGKIIMLALISVFALNVISVYAAEDAHYIQTDDYFISKEPFKDKAWMYVYIAKMVKAPGSESKMEGQFMQIADAKKVWTKYFWTSKMAAKNDIKLGVTVIMPDIAGEGDIYRSPETKEEARKSTWFIAKITDTSDLFKGYVTVSGGYKVSVKALRVISKKSESGEGEKIQPSGDGEKMEPSGETVKKKGSGKTEKEVKQPEGDGDGIPSMPAIDVFK